MFSSKKKLIFGDIVKLRCFVSGNFLKLREQRETPGNYAVLFY
jgi:hypothetical protein